MKFKIKEEVILDNSNKSLPYSTVTIFYESNKTLANILDITPGAVSQKVTKGHYQSINTDLEEISKEYIILSNKEGRLVACKELSVMNLRLDKLEKETMRREEYIKHNDILKDNICNCINQSINQVSSIHNRISQLDWKIQHEKAKPKEISDTKKKLQTESKSILDILNEGYKYAESIKQPLK